jgi:hypothetical protein
VPREKVRCWVSKDWVLSDKSAPLFSQKNFLPQKNLQHTVYPGLSTKHVLSLLSSYIKKTMPLERILSKHRLLTTAETHVYK